MHGMDAVLEVNEGCVVNQAVCRTLVLFALDAARRAWSEEVGYRERKMNATLFSPCHRSFM